MDGGRMSSHPFTAARIEDAMSGSRSSDVWRGAVAGAVGGLVGSTAMVAFNHALSALGVGRNDQGWRQQHRRAQAEPNETDGTIADEPASEKVASNAVEALTGTPLDDGGKKAGGMLVHHAFGATMGALYGAAAARVPQLAAGAGLPYGAFVWVTGAEVGVPLAGLSKPPSAYPPARHAASLGTHLVYGLMVETVRRWMTRR